FIEDTHTVLHHIFSGNSTPLLLARAFVNGSNSFQSLSSPVTATVSGPTVSLMAKTAGLSSNYSVSASSAFDTTDFSAPSYSAAVSGSTLTGGTDFIWTPFYDSGTFSVSINNHTD